MKQRIAATMLIALLPLSLAACGGQKSDSASTTPSAEASTSAAAPTQAAPASSDESTADACMKLAAPMTEAASTISEASQQVTTDPQKAVEAWQALTDAYKSASSSISNADVKNAVDDLAKDTQAVTDQIKAVYVENDLSKIAEYTNAIQNMSSHQETLTNLCNVNK